MKKGRKVTAKQEENSLLQGMILVAKGSIFAVIITLIFIILFAFVMQLSSLSETIIRPIVQVVRILSIAIGGAYAARKTTNKGWLKGAITGIGYVILVSLIGVISGGKFALDRILLSDSLMALVVGAAGGAIGINIR
ncbi:MAG: TIGR04086 family membrane protein [Clostridia bacterium]|nr:TIGR04086 family membrane protein [Clostridia bacterium]MDD4680574.1 TIGR04086 family membrane protein [Clostridia bacterium]